MKAMSLTLGLILLLFSRALAQTNGSSLRLAIVAQEPSAIAAADLLTVELSQKEQITLLERTEIDRVFREQGLSAANKDYLKLGQLLGADGLLLLESVKEGTNQFLSLRLVAVKPGVVIGSMRTPLSGTSATDWERVVNRFNPLFPKLGVLVKDAIPISVVNLQFERLKHRNQRGN
jgi:hypothetical protein